MEYYLFARSLNVVYLDLKIVLVSIAEICCDVELFELFAECLEFRMGHCCARFCDETSSDEENLGHNFRSFVDTASVTTLLVKNSSAECVSKGYRLLGLDVWFGCLRCTLFERKWVYEFFLLAGRNAHNQTFSWNDF